MQMLSKVSRNKWRSPDLQRNADLLCRKPTWALKYEVADHTQTHDLPNHQLIIKACHHHYHNQHPIRIKGNKMETETWIYMSCNHLLFSKKMRLKPGLYKWIIWGNHLKSAFPGHWSMQISSLLEKAKRTLIQPTITKAFWVSSKERRTRTTGALWLSSTPMST